MAAGLEVVRVGKSFGPNRVLEDISLSVAPGEFLSIVGSSGCGKSTLLRIIAGLELQDAGHVAIGGRNVDALSPRARNIAMVFQSYALYPHMSVFDNIALPLMVGQLSLFERLPIVKFLSPRRRKIVRSIAAEVVAVARQLQIEPLLARKPGQLSGGQRQRVALGRAMVRQPSLFLMDEPLSNLDAQLRIHMRDELAELQKRLGATFVYVTHDQVEAMTMSTRIAMLDRGRLAQVGRPRDLYQQPASLAVARFIGAPAINVLAAEADGDGRVSIDGRPLDVRVDAPAGPLTIGIRPEAVALARMQKGAALPARIRRIEYHGSERQAYVDLLSGAGESLIVRLTGPEAEADRQPGQEVQVHFDPARVHYFKSDGERAAIKGAGGGVQSYVMPVAEVAGA